MGRVVITGMGIVAPNGIGVSEFWKSLKSGKSGVAKIESFDVSEYPTKIAAEIKNFDPTRYIDIKQARRMSRGSQFALVAARMAKEDANLEITEENNHDIGIALGAGLTGMQIIEDEVGVLDEKGPKGINPFSLAGIVPNSAMGYICVDLKIKGRGVSLNTGCSSALNAIGYAYECIESGRAKVMFTGGAESPITPLSLGLFCSSRSLSTRNDEPETASRPFDKNRDGYILSEGAGILLLEDYEYAKSRNADIYAEVISYNTTTDAFSMYHVEPSGEEAVRCFSFACKKAGLEPDDIDYINAHGSSSVISDRRETYVIKKCLSKHSEKVMVSSIKSMVGHPLSAAGSFQTIATAMAVKEGIIPPTINYNEKDSDCDLDYVPNEARTKKVDVAVVNALGIGGNNSTLILKKLER